MAQLWAWLLGPRAVVADGVIRVNLASIGNTLANSMELRAPAPVSTAPRRARYQAVSQRA